GGGGDEERGEAAADRARGLALGDQPARGVVAEGARGRGRIGEGGGAREQRDDAGAAVGHAAVVATVGPQRADVGLHEIGPREPARAVGGVLGGGGQVIDDALEAFARVVGWLGAAQALEEVDAVADEALGQVVVAAPRRLRDVL